MSETEGTNNVNANKGGMQTECPCPCRKCVQKDDNKTEKTLCCDCITAKICNCLGNKQDGYGSMELLMLLIRIVIMVFFAVAILILVSKINVCTYCTC